MKKLTLSRRDSKKRSVLTSIRRKGDIPAVIYASGKEGQACTVSGAEFHALLRGLKPGHLPTTQLECHLEDKVVKAIVKDIHYHPTTYDILHIDFFELGDRPVRVKVPLQCTGAADCVGIKLGGFLRQIHRHIKIECEGINAIPSHFSVDVSKLNIGQTVRVGELSIDSALKVLMKSADVVALIAKK